MPKAHADMLLPRRQLRDPATRKRIRMELFQTLNRMGVVRDIRYARDPFDGPLAEQGYPTEEVAIVRAVADVTPR